MYKGRVATIAERLSYAIRTKGVKKIDLCKSLDIPKSALSHYISGKYEPKQDRIHMLALALNISEAWLMGYDVPMDRQTYYANTNKDTPDENNLTEGEEKLLMLYRKASPDTREFLITMVSDFDNRPEDVRKMLLGMIRAAFDNQ